MTTTGQRNVVAVLRVGVFLVAAGPVRNFVDPGFFREPGLSFRGLPERVMLR